MNSNSEGKRSRLLAVINPISGGTAKLDLETMVRTAAPEAGWDPHFCTTCGLDDDLEIARLIKSVRPDRVLVFGGDGTVNLVAGVLINSPIPLAIIPMGSGNGLAKDLRIPLNRDEAFQVALNGRIRKIDTMTLNGKHFLHLSDLGFNAKVVKRFSEMKLRGQISYAGALFLEVFKYRSRKYQIITPDLSLNQRAFMIVVANGNQFGSNTIINPIGELDDGIFEIAILTSFPYLAGFLIYYQLLRRKVFNSRYIKIIRCNHAVIKNPQMELAQMDGEFIEPVEVLKFEINHKSVGIVVGP